MFAFLETFCAIQFRLFMEEGCLGKGMAKEGDNISCPIPLLLQDHVTAEAPRSPIGQRCGTAMGSRHIVSGHVKKIPVNQCCYECREYWGCSNYRLWVWKKVVNNKPESSVKCTFLVSICTPLMCRRRLILICSSFKKRAASLLFL